jgi:sulfite exporter TauE/SafE
VNLPLLFLMGISGSLHCAGMCGPIALLAGGRGLAPYLVGKTTSYVLLGALAGALGDAVIQAGSAGPRVLAIGAGALLLVAGFHSLGLIRDSVAGAATVVRAGRAVASLAGQGHAGKLVLGTANGFLPCPMTYAFVAMAAATGSPIPGAATMLVLGVTTALPLAAAVLAAGRALRFVRWPALSGALMLLAAALTLYRGFAPHVAACH